MAMPRRSLFSVRVSRPLSSLLNFLISASLMPVALLMSAKASRSFITLLTVSGMSMVSDMKRAVTTLPPITPVMIWAASFLNRPNAVLVSLTRAVISRWAPMSFCISETLARYNSGLSASFILLSSDRVLLTARLNSFRLVWACCPLITRSITARSVWVAMQVGG